MNWFYDDFCWFMHKLYKKNNFIITLPWIIRQLFLIFIFNYSSLLATAIIIKPFFTSLLVITMASYINSKTKNINSFILMNNFLTFFYTVILINQFFLIQDGNAYEIIIFKWISLGSLDINFSGFFDTLTFVMLSIITCVSSLVQYYAQIYMKEDPHIARFQSFLLLFTFFMIVLVTSGNFIQLFTGWEGVGICSYLLINFWHTRIQANKAAIKAVLVNRIGDTALAISIFLVFSNFQTLDFSVLSTLITNTSDSAANLLIDINTIALFIFIGCMGKSAQIGLHTWLPDAMEGPTPVSALLHAATMVTAGVFLLIRSSFIFQEATLILPFITIIGALTTFLAASTAIFQNDIKKVIAYSTCSQLGYMIMSCGLGCFNGAIFHLYNHAFFKALLFLTAGSIIHSLDNEQDLRKMGGLLNLLPFSYCMMLIGSLALMGFPFLSGYYSKEFILEIAFSKYTIPGWFAFWLGTLSSSCTAFYSIRSLILIFFNETNSHKKIITSIHDAPFEMRLSLIILSFLSIVSGFLSKDFFIGLGSPFWSNSITIYPINYYNFVNAEFLPFKYKLIPLVFSGVGSILSFAFYLVLLKNTKTYNYNTIYNFFSRKWFFDSLYNDLIIKKSLNFGYIVTHKLVDRGFFEIIAISGLPAKQFAIFDLFKQTQKGHPYHYYLFFISGTLFIYLFIGFFIFLQMDVIFILLLVIISRVNTVY